MRSRNKFSTHIFRSVIIALFFACTFQSLEAQSDSVYINSEDSTWSDWNVRLTPYFWLLGVKGQIAVMPEPAQLPHLPPPIEQLPSGYSIYDIDIGFQEVLNSLKFALMLSGHYKHERFLSQFNVSSIVLESNAISPFDYVFQNNTLRFAYAGGDLSAGYRLIKKRKFEFDLLLGFKFVYAKVGLNTDLGGQVPVSSELSNFWMDPVLGTNIGYRPLKWLELVGYGDMGPTIYNDKLSYQFSTFVNFLITKHFFVSSGYRSYYISANVKEAVFSGTLSGLLVRIGLQF